MCIFNLLASVDPDTQHLLTNLMNVLLPILYTIAGFALIFTIAKYSWKIHSDPENKGEYIRHLVTSVIACGAILLASGIANITFARMLGML